MFKIGDLVKCTSDFLYCKGPKKGKIYKITSLNPEDKMLGVYEPNCTYEDSIKFGEHPNWGYKCFDIIDSSETNYSFLDNLKQNEENYYG